jgi:Mrp family chromosome partitioning ATPase
MPALLSADDTLAFAPYVDCVLVVVDDNHTTKEELVAAGELLANLNVLGSVLNRAGEQAPVDV